MTPYCDTSLFVHLLLPGDRRAAAQTAINQIDDSLGHVPLSAIARFEVIQSLRFEAWRFRNNRTQGTPLTLVETALNAFLAEIGTTFLVSEANWDMVMHEAERLSRTTPEQGWRSMDILHIATATVQRVDEFYSFDETQNKLARVEGMKTPLSRKS